MEVWPWSSYARTHGAPKYTSPPPLYLFACALIWALRQRGWDRWGHIAFLMRFGTELCPQSFFPWQGIVMWKATPKLGRGTLGLEC